MPRPIDKMDITKILMDAENLVLTEGWDIKSPQVQYEKGHSTSHAITRAWMCNHPRQSRGSWENRQWSQEILDAAVIVITRTIKETAGYEGREKSNPCINYWDGQRLMVNYDAWVKTEVMKTYGNDIKTIQKQGTRIIAEMFNRSRRRKDIENCIKAVNVKEEPAT